jgi:predicted DNA-binding transcriptional regulator AlpA
MDRYLSPQQVCEIIPGMTKGSLAQLRFMGKGPRYRKPAPKTVVYRESEILAWVESTSRYGTAQGAV